MTIHLWQIASGLGVGAFIASLFYGVIKQFGQNEGKGFRTSQLGKEATAIIAVLIIIIFGAITVLALVLYAPHEAPPPQPLTSASAPTSVQAPIIAPAITNATPLTDAPFVPPKKSSSEIALAWLALVDDGDYGGSWDEGADSMQQTMKKYSWVQTLTDMRKPLGRPSERVVFNALPWTQVEKNTHQSEVSYRTHFLNDPSEIYRTEWVQISIVNGGHPKVSGYRINPI
jgi:hypothetical protein